MISRSASSIDVSTAAAVCPPDAVDEFRAFWRDEVTYRLDYSRVPTRLTANWILTESRVPWLQLDLPVIDHDAIEREASALEHRFVVHRGDDSAVGWKSLVLHGIDATSTRSATTYGFESESAAPHRWTEIADLCPSTTAFLRSLPLRSLYRVRFMLLEPGGAILPHIDHWVHKLAAINIAISNPRGSYFKMRDYGCVPFEAGKAFLVDIANAHSCVNLSDLPRLHIIVHFDAPEAEGEELVCRSFRKHWLAEAAPTRVALPPRSGFDAARLDRVRVRAKEWVDSGRTQAVVYAIARGGSRVAHEAFGSLHFGPSSPVVSHTSVFRMSSVTKVITATAAMILVDDGRLSLTRPVADYLPEFGTGAVRCDVLVHHLLTHTSGLHTSDYEGRLRSSAASAESQHAAMNDLRCMVAAACSTELRQHPGALCVYAGANYVLLGEIIQRVAGCDLNTFARMRIFEPLSMRDTRYGLDEALADRLVRVNPVIFEDVRPPYDPNDPLDLASPHPGGNLFSTADDMLRFGQMFCTGASTSATRVLSKAAIAAMIRNQIPGVPAIGSAGSTVPEASWGLGWIVQAGTPWKRSHGTLQPPGTIYHQGVSGVGMWCDPVHHVVGVFLSTVRRFEPETAEFHWDFDLFQNLVTAAIL